jgi:hypothetical protein
VLLFAFRIALGVIFLWSGTAKLRSPRTFAAAVEGYRVVPRNLVFPVAVVVTTAEVAVGTTLVFLPRLQFEALVAATGLLAVFASVVGVNAARDNAVPCQCFGPSSSDQISWPLFARAIFLLIIALSAAVIGAGDGHHIQTGAIAPALSFGAAIILTAELIPVVPLAWRAFRTAPATSPTLRHRVSFRHMPLDESLHPALSAFLAADHTRPHTKRNGGPS